MQPNSQIGNSCMDQRKIFLLFLLPIILLYLVGLFTNLYLYDITVLDFFSIILSLMAIFSLSLVFFKVSKFEFYSGIILIHICTITYAIKSVPYKEFIPF